MLAWRPYLQLQPLDAIHLNWSRSIQRSNAHGFKIITKCWQKDDNNLKNTYLIWVLLPRYPGDYETISISWHVGFHVTFSSILQHGESCFLWYTVKQEWDYHSLSNQWEILEILLGIFVNGIYAPNMGLIKGEGPRKHDNKDIVEILQVGNNKPLKHRTMKITMSKAPVCGSWGNDFCKAWHHPLTKTPTPSLVRNLWWTIVVADLHLDETSLGKRHQRQHSKPMISQRNFFHKERRIMLGYHLMLVTLHRESTITIEQNNWNW